MEAAWVERKQSPHPEWARWAVSKDARPASSRLGKNGRLASRPYGKTTNRTNAKRHRIPQPPFINRVNRSFISRD